MRDMKVTERLKMADYLWECGDLKEARAQYAEALRQDPACWHAEFQLVWIDAAFELLREARVKKLLRPGLSEWATQHCAMLSSLSILEGGMDAWDRAFLKAQPEAGTTAFWEGKAERAEEAGQYGLADACYGEAELLDPNGYLYPPKKARVLPSQIRSHLAGLRSALAPQSPPER